MDEPTIGDAFGALMRAALAEETGVGLRPTVAGRYPRPVIEIVERDDGYIQGSPAARYLAPPSRWPQIEHRALAHVRGRVLDIGTGSGRIALELQRRGHPVTGLDTSPGTAEVARARGVVDVVCTAVDEHAGEYDTFLLLGNNLGLLEGRERGPVMLAALAGLAAPGARIVAQGTDPYATADAVHVRYHERNRQRGRLGGQLRVRSRYGHLATDWFDYLLCSPLELAGIVAGSAWRIEVIDDIDRPVYLAVLARRRAGRRQVSGGDRRVPDRAGPGLRSAP
jgi:SAM-dependent methyltransferase